MWIVLQIQMLFPYSTEVQLLLKIYNSVWANCFIFKVNFKIHIFLIFEGNVCMHVYCSSVLILMLFEYMIKMTPLKEHLQIPLIVQIHVFLEIMQNEV